MSLFYSKIPIHPFMRQSHSRNIPQTEGEEMQASEDYKAIGKGRALRLKTSSEAQLKPPHTPTPRHELL